MQQKTSVRCLNTRLTRIVSSCAAAIVRGLFALVLICYSFHAMAQNETVINDQHTQSRNQAVTELIEVLDRIDNFFISFEKEVCSKLETTSSKDMDYCTSLSSSARRKRIGILIESLKQNLVKMELGLDNDDSESEYFESWRNNHLFFQEIRNYWDLFVGGHSTCGLFDEVCFDLSIRESNYINYRREVLLGYLQKYFRNAKIIGIKTRVSKEQKVNEHRYDENEELELYPFKVEKPTDSRPSLVSFVSKLKDLSHSLRQKKDSENGLNPHTETIITRSQMLKKKSELYELKEVIKEWFASNSEFKTSKRISRIRFRGIEIDYPISQCTRRNSELCKLNRLFVLIHVSLSSGIMRIEELDDLALLKDEDFNKFQKTYHRVIDCLGYFDFPNSKKNDLVEKLSNFFEYSNQPELCIVKDETVENFESRFAVWSFIDKLMQIEELITMYSKGNISIKSQMSYPKELIFEHVRAVYIAINELLTLVRSPHEKVWLDKVAENMRKTFQLLNEKGVWSDESQSQLAEAVSCMSVLKVKLDSQTNLAMRSKYFENVQSAIEMKYKINKAYIDLRSGLNLLPDAVKCRL